MIVLSRADVESLLDLDALVDALEPAMVSLTRGEASVPARIFAMVPQAGLLGAMPCYLPGARILETKLVSVFPGNAQRGMHTHQALIAVFDADTGVPAAVMDAAYITAVRTAAGSALAARLLAREDASVLAILGTGVQARAHARAVPRVRPIREVRIAGRDPRKAGVLAKEIGATAASSYAEALDGADIVCATTHSTEPVVRREWLREGTHVNSVGFTEGREIDAATVDGALVVVESRAAAVGTYPNGANELAEIDPSSVTEVGEILLKDRPGRTSPGQITLYKSVGVAVQDAAAAALVLAAARDRGVGTSVDL